MKFLFPIFILLSRLEVCLCICGQNSELLAAELHYFHSESAQQTECSCVTISTLGDIAARMQDHNLFL